MIYMILILTAIVVLIGLGIMLYIIFKPNHTVTDVVDKDKDVCDIEEDKKIFVPCNGTSCGNGGSNMLVQGKAQTCYVKNAIQCQFNCASMLDPSDPYYNIKQYWKQNSKIIVQAGGGANCDIVTTYKIPALSWNKNILTSATPVKDNKIQYGTDYIQKWAQIDGGTVNLPQSSKTVKVPDNNKRAVAVAYPNTPEPENGWPYVFAFDFMDVNGNSVGWGREMMGGIAEVTLDNSYIPNDPETGQLAYMLLKRHIVTSGYALVMISEYIYDTEFNIECTQPSVDGMCWNNGKNVDADAVRVVFEKIRTNSLVHDVKFDYNTMAIMGYSVGAQTVSRMINDFPTMKTSSNASMPTILGGIMIGGGSYHCYEYPTNTPPKNFRPCARWDMSCCPTDKTEDNYDNGVLSDHPPMILLQSDKDMYAAWEASLNYFNILSSRNTACFRIVGPINQTSNLGRHGSYICQIPCVIGFLSNYIKTQHVDL